MSLYPFLFRPSFKERIWGGRNLASLFGKELPEKQVIGESWEIVDRSDESSLIINGALAGKTLHWVMEHFQQALLGTALSRGGRFPLLIKILDASDRLSLQVHPPAAKAAELGGESKTEMWYIVHAQPDAALYVGLQPGSNRAAFEQKLLAGTVEECFSKVPVQTGDTMFLPSGRVHAIGAGLVIFEVQENSDTTYRVFDWNRVDKNGKPRDLHIEESLKCIDFEDFSPSLVRSDFQLVAGGRIKSLVKDPLFETSLTEVSAKKEFSLPSSGFQVVAGVKGNGMLSGSGESVEIRPGTFCLIPAACLDASIKSESGLSFLWVKPGS